MMKTILRGALLGTLLAVLTNFALAQPAPSPAGHWEGKIHLQNQDIPMNVDLARNSRGAWIGTMTIPGSSAADVPVELTVNASSVRFAAYLPDHASFDGQLSSDGKSISGSASNAAGAAPFELTRAGEPNVKLPPASSPLTKDFAGDWLATLERDGKTRRLRLALAPSADGIATGTLVTAVDEQTRAIPITTVTIADKQLTFESRSVSGSFRGTLAPTGEISGEWAQGPARVPLTFKRVPPDAAK